MTSGRVTPSPHTSTTVSSSDASRQERRKWSLLRSRWSWPWPLGRREPAPCCSAPKTPTLSSSCRWILMMTMCWPGCSLCCVVVHVKLVAVFMHVFPPGSDCVFGCHGRSISCNRQSTAHHQVLLFTYFSPVWGRYSHRTKLLHTSLLTSHAQPLHHPSTCLWGTIHKIISMTFTSLSSNVWFFFRAEFVAIFIFYVLCWNCTVLCPLFQVPTEKDTLYLHLLFALKDPSVGTLESNFASTVFYAFSALQVQHSSCHDLLYRSYIHIMSKHLLCYFCGLFFFFA